MNSYKDSPAGSDTSISRRRFLTMSTAAAAGLAAGGTLLSSQRTEAKASTQTGDVEWRNRQSEMAYRQLGRTGYMISEVVSGGDPIRPDNYQHLELALERGLNYLDMASAYGRGDCERAYGMFLDSSSKREKVFLNTKISSFKGVRRQMYQDIFRGLPSGKQEKYHTRAQELIRQRAVTKPGYFFEYYPGQIRAFEPAYLTVAMMEDYAHKVEGSPEFQRIIFESVEESLQRVGTDYFDLAMCPHGADCPEEVQIPAVSDAFNKLKKQGKVRYMGVSSHNDPAGVLEAAAATGEYDVAMVAYNVVNGGYLEQAIRKAKAAGMGVISMKSAMSVATHHERLQPIPDWRIQKVDRIVPGDMKPPLKAYTWSLQNADISAVISNLWNETFVEENLSVAGKQVELQPG